MYTFAITLLEQFLAEMQSVTVVKPKEYTDAEIQQVKSAIGKLKSICPTCDDSRSITRLDAAGSREHITCPDCKHRG